MAPAHPTMPTAVDLSPPRRHGGLGIGIGGIGILPPLDMDADGWESETGEVIAGVFFGIFAALLLIALPLVLCNYCRVRRQSSRAGCVDI